MGSIDWAAVITAAAASNLGVLSLIVLAIAFLAFIFFRTSGDKVKVGVFAAILAAGIGFGTAILRQGLPAGERSAAIVAAGPADNADDGTATGTAAGGRDLSGTWHDDDGYTYAFKAEGSRIRYEQIEGGTPVGSGSGTLVGRTLRYDYVDDRTLDRGSCTGTLATDGAKIEGRCGNGKHEWGFTIMR